MSSFGQYVAGKTIAIVGPAPAPYDQSAEVDAHDLVYRTSYGFNWPNEAEKYTPGKLPSGYGSRVDMAFYNGSASRLAGSGRLDAVYMDLDWAVHKFDPSYTSPLTNVRVANMPRLPGKPLFAPNQVTIMLFDLTFYEVASVTVFGANFYMGATETYYDPEYMPTGWEALHDEPCHSITSAFHDQEDQRVVIRRIRETCGWPLGDERFVRALWTPKERHQAVLDEQIARHAKQAVSV